jgi:hypothetical protein
MPWQPPKNNWYSPAYLGYADLNRIETNTLELKKASTIEITDAGNYFQATNLEAALTELYQKCR